MSDEYQDVLDEEERAYQEAHEEIANQMRALYPTYPVIEYGGDEPERCETCGGFLIFIETQTTRGIDGDNDVSVQDVYHCEQCGAEQRVDLPF